MTKTFPLEALSFLASLTPSVFVAVLLPSSVGEIRCLDVNSVVDVSVARSLDRAVVSRSVVDVLVEIFLKEIVVVSFFFVSGVVATCEDVVVAFCVSRLSAVGAMVEVVLTTVVVSSCFVNLVVTTLLLVLEFVGGIVVTCEDLEIVVVRRVSLLSVVEAMVEVVVITVCEEGEDAQKINSHC